MQDVSMMANSTYFRPQPQKIVTTTEPKQKKSMSNGAKVAIGATALAASVVAGILIKHKINANDIKKMTKNNELMTDIFENCKIKFNTGESLSVKELIEKRVSTYNIKGKTFYHGTSQKAAESISKKGMETGCIGTITGNWKGSYLTEDVDAAKHYAKLAARKYKTQGSVVHIKLPEETKLACFTDETGKIMHDVAYQISENNELNKLLADKKLSLFEFKKFIQDKIAEKGYSGIVSHDSHTGITPVLFDGKLAKVSKLENVV